MNVFNPVSTQQADYIRSVLSKNKRQTLICISIDNENSE